MALSRTIFGLFSYTYVFSLFSCCFAALRAGWRGPGGGSRAAGCLEVACCGRSPAECYGLCVSYSTMFQLDSISRLFTYTCRYLRHITYIMLTSFMRIHWAFCGFPRLSGYIVQCSLVRLRASACMWVRGLDSGGGRRSHRRIIPSVWLRSERAALRSSYQVHAIQPRRRRIAFPSGAPYKGPGWGYGTPPYLKLSLSRLCAEKKQSG